MPVAIRLMRIGKRGSPQYRIVAVDKRKKRTGAYIEKIGFYNPLPDPHVITLDKDKLKKWIDKGAQLSEGLEKLLKRQKNH